MRLVEVPAWLRHCRGVSRACSQAVTPVVEFSTVVDSAVDATKLWV